MPRPTDALGLLGGSRSSYGDGYSRYSADVLPFNVKDYGAKGNNVADDTRALQETIVEAEKMSTSFGSLVAAQVFIPTGRYLITGPLEVRQSYITIFGPGLTAQGGPSGQGFGGAIIRATGNGPMIRNADATANITGIGIFAIGLDGRGMNASATALELDNVGRSTFKNLLISVNGVAGTPVGLKLVGGGAKSTFFNSFENINIISSGRCVELNELCNAHRFIGGVWEGTGTAFYCVPVNTNADTCLIWGTAMQTTGANLIELGTGGGGARFAFSRFLQCRFEPSAPCSILHGGFYTYFTDCTRTSNVTYVVTPALGNVVEEGTGIVAQGALAAGNNNDYVGTSGISAGGAGTLRLTSNGAGSTITGIGGGYDGRRLRVIHVAGLTCAFTHQDAASAAANRIIIPDGATKTLTIDGTAELEYDGTSARWRLVNWQL